MKDRIQSLTDRMPDPWSLCEFAGKSEAEAMIWQTLKACLINEREHGEFFSFKGKGVLKISGGGLADNPAAYALLKRRGWVEEAPRPGIDAPDGTCRNETGSPLVILPTPKLLDDLDAFLD